jgi:hypothetical protein
LRVEARIREKKLQHKQQKIVASKALFKWAETVPIEKVTSSDVVLTLNPKP